MATGVAQTRLLVGNRQLEDSHYDDDSLVVLANE